MNIKLDCHNSIEEKNLRKKNEYIKIMENILKDYYYSRKRIRIIENKINILYKRKKVIEKKIKSSDITLEPCIKSNNYDNEIRVISTVSIQERALERVFSDLENELDKIQDRIKVEESMRYEIIMKNFEIEEILNHFTKESKLIIERLYKDKKSLVKIAIDLNLDESNIRRRKEKILKDMHCILFYY